MGVKTHLAASSEREKKIFDFTQNRLLVPGFRIKDLISFFSFLFGFRIKDLIPFFHSPKWHLCDARTILIGKLLPKSCGGKPRQSSSMRGIICMFKYTLCCLQPQGPTAWFTNKLRCFCFLCLGTENSHSVYN